MLKTKLNILFLLLTLMIPTLLLPQDRDIRFTSDGYTAQDKADPESALEIPKFILEGGFGLFYSFISDFGNDFIRRPILRLGGSVRTLDFLYLYYQVSRYPTEKRTPVQGTIDNSVSMTSENFVELIQNFGIRITGREFLPMKNSMTWVGLGLSALKTENTFITVWTTKDFNSGTFNFVDNRLEEVVSVKKTGFFIETGHLLHDADIHGFGLTWGFSIIMKYDYGKTAFKDIGGFSFLLGTHLLKF